MQEEIFNQVIYIRDFLYNYLHPNIKLLTYLLIAILAVCTIHLVLFIIKWICDNRKNKQ